MAKKKRKQNKPGSNAPRQQSATLPTSTSVPSPPGEPSLKISEGRCALELVAKVQSSDLSNYQTYLKAAPAQVLLNSLGQAVAIWLMRGRVDDERGRAYRLMADHLAHWLLRQSRSSPYHSAGAAVRGQDLLQTIHDHSRDQPAAVQNQDYACAQELALSFLGSLKKIANARTLEVSSADVDRQTASST